MQLTPMNIEKLKKASRLGGKKADNILDTLTIRVGYMKEDKK